ncbi:hypothetical protein OSB04_006218 [Centaurea solstitialis]|uniref:Uncharacterized protein n=1 Tax=Centaurea solstitialis TaxID=347529 RepID=A0AA38THH7_9ASTR|nr:hypothetical protein OSB04_006218 [Centaurea solstitialis]
MQGFKNNLEASNSKQKLMKTRCEQRTSYQLFIQVTDYNKESKSTLNNLQDNRIYPISSPTEFFPYLHLLSSGRTETVIIFTNSGNSVPTAVTCNSSGNFSTGSDSTEAVIEKIEKRLGSWKSRLMSFDGRFTLVKLVLGSLPLYFFSLCYITK